jgi:hypothetical protein
VILGLNIAAARCGWALLDEQTCSFQDLGVVAPHRFKGQTVTLDRARAGSLHAQVLAAKAPGCTAIVVEQLSLEALDQAEQLALGMSWGIVLGVIATMEPAPSLFSIPAGRWQREVLPNAPTGREIDAELARAAAAHILRSHPKAAKALRAIADADRPHAMTAAMIALCGFLRFGAPPAPEGQVA